MDNWLFKIYFIFKVSYVIRDAEEKQHRNGINAMQLDPNNGKLYSAGRDAIIRVWNSRTESNEKYIQSMEHHNDWVNDIVLCCNGRNRKWQSEIYYSVAIVTLLTIFLYFT